MTTKNHITTDDFDPQTFRPHGRVTFSVDGNVLMCDAVGPFNKELIEAIEGVELKLIDEMKQNEKWGDIVTISGSALGSSETLQAFTDYLKMLVAGNFISNVTAMVIDKNVEGAGVMTPYLIKAYADAGLKLTVFETLNEAKVWVKLHL